MFALAAVVVFFLAAFGVIDDTENVRWILVGLGLVALHLVFAIALPFERFHRD